MKRSLLSLSCLLFAATAFCQDTTASTPKVATPHDTTVFVQVPVQLYRSVSTILAQLAQKADAEADQLLDKSKDSRQDSKVLIQIKELWDKQATYSTGIKK